MDGFPMTRFARILRDVCLIGVGVLTLIQTPPSVQDAALHGILGVIWACMLGLGALASLYGVTFKNLTAEILGCAFVGAGFAVWAFTSITRSDATLTSYALALVFISGFAGQLYRIGMISEGRVAR